jgi:hypothetical protein
LKLNKIEGITPYFDAKKQAFGALGINSVPHTIIVSRDGFVIYKSQELYDFTKEENFKMLLTLKEFDAVTGDVIYNDDNVRGEGFILQKNNPNNITKIY